MNKFLALLFLLTLSVLGYIAVMIYGWGLEPVSWFWIIGVGVFFNTFVALVIGKVIEGK